MFHFTPLSIAVLVLSLVLGSLYAPTSSNPLFVTQRNGTQTPFKSAQRVLLVTAHPDDEAMFFAPTLVALRDAKPVPVVGEKTVAPPKPTVFNLCLTTGNADGLGTIRMNEMNVALDVLGIQKGNRWVLDRPEIRDSIVQYWDVDLVAQIINTYARDLRIDTILTFDKDGVSSHPNHISLHSGAVKLIENLNATLTPSSKQKMPRLYTLTSSPLYSKYTSLLSVPFAKLQLIGYTILSSYERFVIRVAAEFIPILKETGPHPIHLDANLNPMFVNGARQYVDSLAAMRAYVSQMVWFRWGWVTFSEYMWVNNWKLENPEFR